MAVPYRNVVCPYCHAMVQALAGYNTRCYNCGGVFFTPHIQPMVTMQPPLQQAPPRQVTNKQSLPRRQETQNQAPYQPAQVPAQQPQAPPQQQAQQYPYQRPIQYQQYTGYQPQYYRQYNPERDYSWEVFPWSYPRPVPTKKRAPRLELAGLLLTFTFIVGIVALIFLPMYPVLLDAEAETALEGRVMDEDGDGLGQVLVKVEGTDLETLTNSRGYFSFSEVPAGEITISFKKDGYKPLDYSTFIINNVDDEMEVTLENGTEPTEISSGRFRDWTEFYSSIYASAILLGVFAAFTGAGAYYAHSGKHFAIVAVGGLTGAFLPLFPVLAMGDLLLALSLGMFMGSVCSLTAMVLVIGDKEFFEEFKVPVQ